MLSSSKYSNFEPPIWKMLFFFRLKSCSIQWVHTQSCSPIYFPSRAKMKNPYHGTWVSLVKERTEFMSPAWTSKILYSPYFDCIFSAAYWENKFKMWKPGSLTLKRDEKYKNGIFFSWTTAVGFNNLTTFSCLISLTGVLRTN